MGAIDRLLSDDHRRLEALLAAALDGDGAAYEEFRGGLLRHIAMEEKVLLPEARRRRGEPLPVARQLRLDHGALAALLVPTPTPALLAQLRALLEAHNPLEEGPDGVYRACEALVGADADALVQRLTQTPAVPPAPHFDGPRAFASIERALRAAGR